MSCGKPHNVPCTDVLDRVYSYLDGELDDGNCTKIREHLDECGPCLREYGLEEAVKQLVHRCCGNDAAPGELRAKVMMRIQQVKAETRIGSGQADLYLRFIVAGIGAVGAWSLALPCVLARCRSADHSTRR